MKYLQKKYALSEQGAKDLCKGIVYSALAYISLMLPVALLAYVLNVFLAPLLGEGTGSTNALLYTIIGVAILALIFLLHYMQYTVTYLGTFRYSAVSAAARQRACAQCHLPKMSSRRARWALC